MGFSFLVYGDLQIFCTDVQIFCLESPDMANKLCLSLICTAFQSIGTLVPDGTSARSDTFNAMFSKKIKARAEQPADLHLRRSN